MNIDNWHSIEINHTQKNSIRLYCKNDNSFVLIKITSRVNNKVRFLKQDILIGSIQDIFLDQFKNLIEWDLKHSPPISDKWEFDMLAARKRHGQQDTIDYLKYHIANAMNETQNNRSFSKYAKEKIIGCWENTDFKLNFNSNGIFNATKLNSKKINEPLRLSEGEWSISSNMLGVWNRNKNMGFRRILVDITNDHLIFLGDNGQLFYTFKRHK